MQNNIPAHNHTVYSYLQALLTYCHKVSDCTASYINSRYKVIKQTLAVINKQIMLNNIQAHNHTVACPHTHSTLRYITQIFTLKS